MVWQTEKRNVQLYKFLQTWELTMKYPPKFAQTLQVHHANSGSSNLKDDSVFYYCIETRTLSWSTEATFTDKTLLEQQFSGKEAG